MMTFARSREIYYGISTAFHGCGALGSRSLLAGVLFFVAAALASCSAPRNDLSAQSSAYPRTYGWVYKTSPPSTLGADFALSELERRGLRKVSYGANYKIGNPYSVKGRTYRPRENWNYRQKGIASWYGPQFHGKKTANGGRFDMNVISAAHRTLPLPSVVRVVNLENGRSVILVVNDRGPYAHDRIIDISRKGAEKLGFIKVGTALVRVEILPEVSRALREHMRHGQGRPDVVAMLAKSQGKGQHSGAARAGARSNAPAPRTTGAPPPSRIQRHHRLESAEIPAASGLYFVQIGSYRNPSTAARVREEATRKGIRPIRVVRGQVNGGLVYRVRMGPFSSRSQAENAGKSAKRAGIPVVFVVRG